MLQSIPRNNSLPGGSFGTWCVFLSSCTGFQSPRSKDQEVAESWSLISSVKEWVSECLWRTCKGFWSPHLTDTMSQLSHGNDNNTKFSQVRVDKIRKRKSLGLVAQMVKNPPAMWSSGWIPGSGRSPGEGNGTPVFLPGEFHRWRSLAGSSPWGHKESGTT